MANIDTAMPPLVTDIARLATEGLKSNSCEKTGINGCVQYVTPKEAKVPKNNAEMVRQNPGAPF